MRREYEINPIIVNGLSFKKLIIDPHVDKHSEHISDELIFQQENVVVINILHPESNMERDFINLFGCWKKTFYILV